MRTLKYAWRFLMRSKSYTIINLLGLAFSLACSIILIRYIHRELTVDAHSVDPEHIIIPLRDMEGNIHPGSLQQDWTEADSVYILDHQIVEQCRLMLQQRDNVVYENSNYAMNIAAVDSTFFHFFHYPIVAGEASLEAPNDAIITQHYARNIFGKERKIKELPMITEVMQPDYYPIVSQLTAIGQFDNWEGLDIPIDTPVPVKLFLGKEDFFRFYDITLLAGEWLDDLSTYEDIIINESLARRMGWSPQEAIGKHIIQSYITYTIVGVVKDCHYGAPTLPIPHTGFLVGEQMGLMQRSAGILFKYKEGTWNECRKALEHLYQTECSPENILRLNSEEEVYNNYLRSEEMLTRLLSFASLVCILTAMFGIYSLVTLTCEQRRKEIAIRKVNGATVWSILFLFFREYLIMLCIAALFAFPITYVIIKQWILNYVRQVSISPLPFILILIGLALTVIAGISWRVWKAANENPAEVIKNE